MNLYIMRHASAGTRRVNPLLDKRRPLDKQGKKDCLLLGNTLSNLKVSFDLIVSSPLKRSLQTASLVGTETGYEQKILMSEALLPGATFAQFERLLADCRQYESLLVVGHSPTVVEFLGRLILPAKVESSAEGAEPIAPVAVRMRKGAIARVSLDGVAMLQWMLDPRMLRTLYATSISRSRRKTSRK